MTINDFCFYDSTDEDFQRIYKVHRILLMRKRVHQTRLVENDS